MKATKISLTLALATISGSLFAQTIVTVNGSKIDSSEIDAQVRSIVTQSGGQIQDGPELRQRITDNLVINTLVNQEGKRLKLDQSAEYKKAEAEAMQQAKSKGLDKKPEFSAQWAGFQNELMMSAYADYVLKKNPVSDAETKQQYDVLKAKLNNTDEVQLGQIVAEKAQAAALAKDVTAKKSFEDIAKKYQGALDTDYVPVVLLKEDSPEIYQLVANLNKGEYSKPVVQDNANIIFYVNDKRKIQIGSYEEMKPGLLNAASEYRFRQSIDELGQKAKIVPAN